LGGVIVVLSCAISFESCRNPRALAAQHLQRGDRYAQQQKYEEALIEYRGAVQANPRSGESQKKLGQTYLRLAAPANALAAYVRAADLLPEDVEAQLAAGHLLQDAGQFIEARARAQAALAKDPKNTQAQLLIGYALLGLDEPDRAV